MTAADAGITVVVCTRNRAARLARMLTSLEASYQAEGAVAPVLIVDNGSTDTTHDVVASFAARLPLCRVHHKVAGLSAARNRAISECRSNVIWFLDDDVTVSPGWFSGVRAAVAAQPNADWFGGRVLPAWEVARPNWLGDGARYRGLFVWYDPGGADRVLSGEMPYFFGANFGFRRRVFTGGLRFDEQLGKIGDRPRLGEDFALQHTLERLGRRGFYVASATVEHPVEAARIRLPYLTAWHFESGRATVAQAVETPGTQRWLGTPRFLYRRTLELWGTGGVQLLGGGMLFNARRTVIGLSELCRAAGMMHQIVCGALAQRRMGVPRDCAAAVDANRTGAVRA